MLTESIRCSCLIEFSSLRQREEQVSLVPQSSSVPRNNSDRAGQVCLFLNGCAKWPIQGSLSMKKPPARSSRDGGNSGTDGRPMICKTPSVTGRQEEPVLCYSHGILSCWSSRLFQERIYQVASTLPMLVTLGGYDCSPIVECPL